MAENPRIRVAGYAQKVFYNLFSGDYIFNNMRKLTTKQFIDKAMNTHGTRYGYDKTKYNGSMTKVKITCPTHGEFFQRPRDHINGQGCPECSGNRTKNTKEVITEFTKVHGDKYDYSFVEYVNTHTKVKIICPTHGEFKQSPKYHKTGSGCPKCANNIKLTTEEFISKAKDIHGNKYDYSLVDYIADGVKVKIICPTHGEYYQTPNRHISKSNGCPFCGREKQSVNSRLTTDEFISKAKDIHGDKYDYSLVDYVRGDMKVKIICPTHGEFSQSGYIHLAGSGCQICKESKGEKLVRRYLLKEGYTFDPQYTFDGCVGISGRKLPFDFYLPELNICIEYDGRQHYEPIKIFGGKLGYEERIVNDKIKNDYCNSHGIKLIRIPYFDNVDKVLKNELWETVG